MNTTGLRGIQFGILDYGRWRIYGNRVFIQDNVRAFRRGQKMTVRRGSNEFKAKNDLRATNKGNIFRVTCRTHIPHGKFSRVVVHVTTVS